MHQIVIDISNILVNPLFILFAHLQNVMLRPYLIIKNKDLHLYTCLSMCISLIMHNI